MCPACYQCCTRTRMRRYPCSARPGAVHPLWAWQPCRLELGATLGRGDGGVRPLFALARGRGIVDARNESWEKAWDDSPSARYGLWVLDVESQRMLAATASVRMAHRGVGWYAVHVLRKRRDRAGTDGGAIRTGAPGSDHRNTAPKGASCCDGGADTHAARATNIHTSTHPCCPCDVRAHGRTNGNSHRGVQRNTDPAPHRGSNAQTSVHTHAHTDTAAESITHGASHEHAHRG